ncbi:MAG: prepilin-type N-terminal cleavage/methylation domain-containing protein [Planctomycetota bacterium]
MTLLRHGRRAARRAFSLVEMLIALTISSLLLTATMVALDTTFKGYEMNADSASSNVVTRIAVNRLLTLIRTGTEFGPMPVDVLDSAQNPLVADYFEFVSERDDDGDAVTITRIEYRYPEEGAQYRSWGIGETPPALSFEPSGPGDLYIVQIDAETSAEEEFILLREVRSAQFTLRYDIGPHLRRATIDVTVEPAVPEDIKLESDAPPQVVRVVASAMPRQLVN